MKKSSKQFLLITFILSYLCFGPIVYSRIVFSQIFNNSLYLCLFILGCLGPFTSAFIVHALNKEELGGVKGFIDKLRMIKSAKTILLIPIYIIAHYGFAILLKGIYKYGSITDFFSYLPMMILILGSQEIGWRGILQRGNEEKNGVLKSSIITGLFWSLWFLPLIYIPQFLILPQFYAQFAAYLVGISILLTTLYKSSGSIAYCILLSSLIFSLFSVFVLKQGFMLVVLALVDAIIANTFKNIKEL